MHRTDTNLVSPRDGLMKLNQLRDIVAVAERGSLRAAVPSSSRSRNRR